MKLTTIIDARTGKCVRREAKKPVVFRRPAFCLSFLQTLLDHEKEYKRTRSRSNYYFLPDLNDSETLNDILVIKQVDLSTDTITNYSVKDFQQQFFI
jgi:hypothetical protein